MPPQAETVIDNFDRSDRNLNVGGDTDWTADPLGESANALSIEGNNVEANLNAYCASYWDAGTFGPDLFAGFTLTAVQSGAFSTARIYFALVGGIGTTAVDGYALFIYTDRVELFRIDNGDAETNQLGADFTNTATAGDKYLIERIGDQFEVWRHRSSTWTSLGTRTDSTYTGSGHVGMAMYDPGSTGVIDDFMAGTLAGGGTDYDADPNAAAASASGPLPSVTTVTRPYTIITIA